MSAAPAPSAPRRPLREQLVASGTYSILYMFGMTFVMTLVLVGIGAATQDRVEANRQARFERAVLEAGLGPAAALPKSGLDVHRLYLESVVTTQSEHGVEYRVMRNGEFVAFAVPYEGQGFWDRISGVLGVGPDGRTLTGFAVVAQSETPGLGAEIATPAFRGRMPGRVLAEGERPLAIVPIGGELRANEVHAVTGATQTCNRLERMLNRAVVAWRALRAAAGEASP